MKHGQKSAPAFFGVSGLDDESREPRFASEREDERASIGHGRRIGMKHEHGLV